MSCLHETKNKVYIFIFNSLQRLYFFFYKNILIKICPSLKSYKHIKFRGPTLTLEVSNKMQKFEEHYFWMVKATGLGSMA
jgi:hypothetical protein